MMERTFTFVDETISVDNRDDGSHVVKVAPDGTKILAYLANGKVTRYAAEDSSGNSKPLLSITAESPDLFKSIIPGITEDIPCMVCYHDEAVGAVICYQLIECPPFTGPEKLLR